MIDDPPLIRLRRTVPRPTPEQLAALWGTPTGYVCDALHGRASLGVAAKPVVPEQAAFCGVALTIHTGPDDNLAVLAALPLIQPSDVLVVAADGYRTTAVVGDLVLGMARNRGVAAFVTDGCVRDVPGIRDVGLRCDAAGLVSDSPGPQWSRYGQPAARAIGPDRLAGRRRHRATAKGPWSSPSR